MERQRHRVAADTIIEKDGRVALVKRGQEPFQDMWVLPGGHVEEGERVREAAVREAKEETDLDIEVEDVLGIYDDPGRDPRGPVISVAYVCSTNQEELEADTDADEARWFFLQEIPDEMGFDHRQILDDYLEERK